MLQRLAFEQRVELKKNRGAFIASPSTKDARDVFEARRVIERVTTEIVARTIVTPSIHTLREYIRRQDDAVSLAARKTFNRRAFFWWRLKSSSSRTSHQRDAMASLHRSCG